MEKCVKIKNEDMITVTINGKPNVYMVTESANGPHKQYLELTHIASDGIPKTIGLEIHEADKK